MLAYQRLAADLAGDLRHGVRLLRLNPGFAAVAVLSLALGVGANTAIFQLLNTVRLRTLPINRPAELVKIRVTTPGWRPTIFFGQYQEMTNPLWERIRDRQQAFSRIAAVGGSRVNLAQGGQVQYAQGLWVSGEFFEVLEVQPVLGRVLTGSDDRPGCGSPSTVISYDYWQREFGGDPTVLGKKLMIKDRSFEIVGVTQEGFFGVEVGRSYDLAIPLCAQSGLFPDTNALERRDLWWVALIGRLKPDWSLERASAHLAALSPELMRETAPTGYSAVQVRDYLALSLGAVPADSGFSQLRERYEDPLWMRLGIAGVVLLIACANLANLMLARAGVREREIAVRLAIGAPRGRLVRQLLAESLLLATIGSLCGWFLARGLSRVLISFLNSFGARGNQVFLDLRADWRMLAFTLCATVLTTVLFGLAPALRGARTPPSAALAAGRTPTSGRGRFSLRRVLLVAQVALSLVLIVGGLLFARSLGNLLEMKAGFRQEGILLVTLDYVRLNLPLDRRHDFKRNMLARIRAIPGVVSVAETAIVPAGLNYWTLPVHRDLAGSTGSAGSDVPSPIRFNWVSPGFFQTMETTMLAGRDFDSSDSGPSPKVAVVNEAFVRSFFPGADPIGKTFRSDAEPGYPDSVYEVVGLVKDSKYRDIREDFQPIVFAPEAQHPSPTTFQVLMIRSDAPIAGLVAAIKEAVAATNPEITLDFEPFRNLILRLLLRERLMASLSGFFAALAALLATMGLYGVLSYMVVQRTREIGIRMALGAAPGAIVRMILREAVSLLLMGLGIGTGIALLAVNLASKLLFGLSPRDPLSFAGAILLLSLAALAAGYIPARRASRLQPMAALREE